MKNFNLLSNGCATQPLEHAIARQPRLWNQHNIRTTYPSTPHGDVDDILLRFNEYTADEELKVIDDVKCISYPAWNLLPQVRPLVFDLMRLVEGEQLGRVIVTRLAPGGWITPHVDQGAPAEFYDRYQIMLRCTPGVEFRCDNEKLEMLTGQCWWFNNQLEHEVKNNSSEDRLALIIDIRASR